MSASMMYQQTGQIVQAAPQYAQPVNAVWESVAAPMVSTIAAPTTTTLMSTSNVASYSSLSAPIAIAAPTVVETISAPTVQYAAPAVQQATTIVAAPVYSGSIAAPVAVAAPYQTSTIVAAPQQTAIVTQAPSYVAQSVVAAPVIAAPFQEPPKPLTAGIPNPDQIKAQKEAYSAALDKQLKDGIDTISKETEIEKKMIMFNADKQIALMQMQVEEQRNEKIALLDEQATIRQCELRKAYVERKLQLDNQANGFIMDYQVKAVQTELAQKNYQFQQTYNKNEGELEAKYAKEVAKASQGTSYTIPAQAVSR